MPLHRHVEVDKQDLAAKARVLWMQEIPREGDNSDCLARSLSYDNVGCIPIFALAVLGVSGWRVIQL